MVEQAQFAGILDGIEELEILQNFRRVRVNSSGAVVQGEADIEGHLITIEIELGPSFPLALPRFVLRPWDALGYIPHVIPNGIVCFLDPEGIVLDQRRPEQVVKDGFDQVVSLLLKGVTGQNQSDFVDEFAACWGFLGGNGYLLSLLDPGEDLDRVYVASGGQSPPVIARKRDEISAFCHGARVPRELILRSNALYLPLRPGTTIIPPRPDRPFWTAEDARNVLLPGLSDGARERLRKLTHPRPRETEYVVIRLPRPSGGESLFGLRYEGVGDRHPLHPNGTALRVIPIQIERLDRTHLIGRGGADAALGAKRVLLVGCGAVGGHVAFGLARSGVLDLTLNDHDRLMSENAFRHVLGLQFRGKEKVVALKQAIEAQLPYVRVTTVAMPIEEALLSRRIDLSNYDLVVLATGNPTVELMVNERLHRLDKGPPAVIAWVEPLGIGGHVLLANNGSRVGCFECLYTTPEGGWEGANRAAFADRDQSFGRASDGCGSLYTPFGSVDAEQTAILAVRLAVEVLIGKETGNPLVSWKGDASAFTAAGFHLSERYAFSDDELRRQRHAYPRARCPICSDSNERVAA